MVQPLTKCKEDGTRYTRPPEIEARLQALLQADLPTIQVQALEEGWASPDFIPSECLVHLVRQAIKNQDEPTTSTLLPILLERGKANLVVKIKDADFPNAGDLREEVLGQLAELFAEDQAGSPTNDLDFFEVRFNSAFFSLRAGVIRDERLRKKELTQFPISRGEDGMEDSGEVPSGKEFSIPATQFEVAEKHEILEGIFSLPENERDAILLHFYCHMEVESKDPKKATVARYFGVSGRTVRNWLKSATSKLSRIMEAL